MFWKVLFHLIEGTFHSIQHQQFLQLSITRKLYSIETAILNIQSTSTSSICISIQEMDNARFPSCALDLRNNTHRTRTSHRKQ